MPGTLENQGMNLQDIVYPLGELLVWAFGLLQTLDNLPNFLIVVLGFGGVGLWMLMQKKYTAKAVLENGLK